MHIYSAIKETCISFIYRKQKALLCKQIKFLRRAHVADNNNKIYFSFELLFSHSHVKFTPIIPVKREKKTVIKRQNTFQLHQSGEGINEHVFETQPKKRKTIKFRKTHHNE